MHLPLHFAMGKSSKRKREDAAAAAAPSDAPHASQQQAKKKRKKKKKKQQAPAPAATAPAAAAAPEDAALLASLTAGDGGSLSDRLNPDQPHFDAALKARWKSMGKRARAALVAADAARHAAARAAGERNLAALPFAADADDHCESPPEAYGDVAGVLDLVAAALGKSRRTLAIYDPYYCAGAVKAHLGALGFENVRNDRADFYETLRRHALPPHDVVVTNPPYSGDHVHRLLDFCRTHDRPYLLLMPNYVAAKPDFLARVSGNERPPPVYVCPRKRYCYWTPKAMRAKDKMQGHVSALGHRTSPFASFWYVELSPRCDAGAVRRAFTAGGPHVCATLAELPTACRPD